MDKKHSYIPSLAFVGIFATTFLFINLNTATNEELSLPYEFFTQLRINVSSACLFLLIANLIMITAFVAEKEFTNLKNCLTVLPTLVFLFLFLHYYNTFNPSDYITMARPDWLAIDKNLSYLNFLQFLYWIFTIVKVWKGSKIEVKASNSTANFEDTAYQKKNSILTELQKKRLLVKWEMERLGKEKR